MHAGHRIAAWLAEHTAHRRGTGERAEAAACLPARPSLPGALALLGRFARRHFLALAPRFRQADRDRLFAAFDLSSRATALQCTAFALFHRAADLGGCLPGISACHGNTPLREGVIVTSSEGSVARQSAAFKR